MCRTIKVSRRTCDCILFEMFFNRYLDILFGFVCALFVVNLKVFLLVQVVNAKKNRNFVIKCKNLVM